MEELGQPGGDEARCATHPEVAAVSTCIRCGAFVCDPCAGSTGACPSCQRHPGHSDLGLDRERWTIRELLELVWRRFQVRLPLLSGAAAASLCLTFCGTLLLFAGLYGLDELLGAPESDTRPALFFLLLLYFAFFLNTLLRSSQLELAHRVVLERAVAGEGLLAPFRRIPALLGWQTLVFLVALITLLFWAFAVGFLLAIIGRPDLLLDRPGVWVALAGLLALPLLWLGARLSLVRHELVVGGRGLLGAIAASWRITRGRTLRMVALHGIALFALLPGLVLMGIGVFAARGFAHALIAGAWELLREPAAVDPAPGSPVERAWRAP